MLRFETIQVPRDPREWSQVFPRRSFASTFQIRVGEICTKPFFDEEAAREKEAWLKEHEQAPVATTPSAVTVQSNTNAPFVIPAALLQQYPALADLGLTSLHVASTPPDEEAYGDRSAFDE
jgi:hypothetical protein